MAQPLAVVDTCVIVLLLTKSSPNEAESVRTRRELAEVAINDLRKDGARFVVPTPVIAELCSTGSSGADVVRKRVTKHLRRVKTLPLDVASADVAGQMMKNALASRAPGEARGAVRYDALIAAIAHSNGARWLVTDNRKDMAKCLGAVNSTVELVVTSALPKKGQLHLVHIGAKKQ